MNDLRRGTLGDLLRGHTTATPTPVRRVHDIYGRWHLPAGNLNARGVQERLEKAWMGWSATHRETLLRAAEAIADAERAKREWNPKTNEGKYLDVAKSGTDALQLAAQIRKLIPPPWKEDAAAAGELVERLVSYSQSALRATMSPPKDTAIAIAAAHVENLRAFSRKHGRAVAWELIRDLSWLAADPSGDGDPPDESTVRRYLRHRKPSPTPAHRHWMRWWTFMRETLRTVPLARRDPDRFRKLLESSLRPG